MLFKYWVEFDEDGDIVGLYKDSTPDCIECLVKVTPIKRSTNDKLEKVGKETLAAAKKFKTEVQRISKDLRRIKI